MKRVLITGVAGFIGSHVARRFIEEGVEVFGVDDLSGGKKENLPEKIGFLQADLAQKEVIKLLPATCDLILHLAGQSSGEISFDDPVSDLAKNTASTLNLIQYGIEKNVDRIIYASSMSVYGEVPDQPISEERHCEPLSCYGVGKLAAENYLRVYQHKLPYVALRMFNVYGPGQDMANLRQGMVSIYLAQAINSGRIEVKGSVDRFRDFIFIDNVVEAWWKVANDSSIKNQILNVGSGIRITVAQLLEYIERLVPGSCHYISNNTLGDQSGIYADNKRLVSLINLHKFTPIELGLDLLLNYEMREV